MKKHIIGLALFSFIVSAAAIVYAIFNVPEIIPVSVVPQYNSANLPTSCWKMRREKKDITFEVISTQLDLKTGILTSKINLKWNGFGKPPEKVTTGVHLFTVEDDEEGLFNEKQVFIHPFGSNSEATVLIKYKVRFDLSYSPNKNLYALIEFSPNEKFEGYIEGKEDISKAHSVLLIHGNSSMIRR